MLNNIYNKLPSTDALCIIPGVQQVIGAGTVFSNIGKAISDAAERAGLFIDERQTNKNFDLLQKNDDAVLPLHLKNRIAKEELKEHKEVLDNKAIPENKANFFQHIKYIAIGIIRMIPVVGSAYSIYVENKKYNAMQESLSALNELCRDKVMKQSQPQRIAEGRKMHELKKLVEERNHISETATTVREPETQTEPSISRGFVKQMSCLMEEKSRLDEKRKDNKKFHFFG